MKVSFEGQTFDLPDDSTPDEVGAILQAAQPAGFGDVLQAIPGTARGIAQQALGGTIQAMGERVPDVPAPSPFVSKLFTALASRIQPTEKDKAFAEVGRIVAEQGEAKVREEDPGSLSYWKRATLSGGSSALAMAPGLAASLLTKSPVPAVLTATAQAGGQTYAESRKAGETPEEAAKTATIDIAAEAIFEYLPMKFLVDNVGGPVLKTIAGTLVREVPTEVMTTAVQSANARLRDKEKKNEPWDWEGYAQDLLDTVGSTMVAAPLTAGTAAILDRTIKAGAPTKGAGGEPPPPSPSIPPGPGAPAADIGAGNVPLSAPFDQPTTIPDSGTKAELDAIINSIDAELLDDKQVEAAKAAVAKYEEQRKAPALTNPQLAWPSVATAPQDVEDIGELGASAKQAKNAQNYVNPNQGDRMQFPIFAGPEGTQGLTLGQVPPQPATFVIGQPSDDRPADMLQAMHETVESWRQKYMPDATIVLSNERLFTDSALGWHYSAAPGQHIIVPAVLRKPTQGLGAFNVNTQAGVFYNLTHEFGHALVTQRFFEGVTPEMALVLRAEILSGIVSEQTLLSLPEDRAAVIREYNEIKARVLNNSMSAEEFVQAWFSPAKLGRKTLLEDLGVTPTDNALAVVKAVVNRAVTKAQGQEKKRVLRQKLTEDFLSLDEYLAEQTARFAYQRKWDEQSALGRFFKSALESLRAFFTGAKRDGLIAPGTAFGEWLDGLTKADRPVTEGRRVAEGKKKATASKAKVMPVTQEAGLQFTPTVAKSGFQPHQNIFNTPELKQNRTFAWRSMGASEFKKLLGGEMRYSGDKAATKSNFLAGIPESAGQYGGKGRYLVEFGKVRIVGDEGLVPGAIAVRENISNVWQHDGSRWIEQTAPFRTGTDGKIKVQKVQHNVETSTVGGKQQRGRQLVVGLVRSGLVEANSQEMRDMLDLVKREEFDEFIDQYKRYTNKTIKFQTDEEAEKVGVKTDLAALIEVFGLNMYAGNVPDVITKELVQNSFDAVKAALFKKQITEGVITVGIDKQERQIVVLDNGIGMDRETLLKALLTYPGTSKPDLPVEHRSGGLGQAKQLLLFTPESIEVLTTKGDGIAWTLKGTPQQLLKNQATLEQTSTEAPAGTRVTITLPKQVIRDGKLQPVEIETWKGYYQVAEHPPLFPDVKLIWSSGKQSWQSEEIEPLYASHSKLFRKDFEFGYVDVYKGETFDQDHDYRAKHRVMSAGVWQFNIQVPLDIGKIDERLPMDLIFDIHAKVPGQHSAYPFTPNREGLKEGAKKQLFDSIDDVREEYFREMLRKHVETYTNVKMMPTFEVPEFTVAKDKDGIPTVTFADPLRAKQPLYFNPTNKDYLQIQGAPEFINDLAGLYREFLALYSAKFDPFGSMYRVGVGFDRGHTIEQKENRKRSPGWSGVAMKKPYHAVFINPGNLPEVTQPEAAAASTLHVMMHEAAHIQKGAHGDAYVWQLALQYARLDQGKQLSQIKDKLVELFTTYWPTFQEIKNAFDAPDTGNVSATLKGDVLNAVANASSPADAIETLRGGRERGGSDLDGTDAFRNVSFELDLDDREAPSKFYSRIRNFLADFKPLRIALRKASHAAYYLLELQQLAHLNPDISELTYMNEENTNYNRRKSALQAPADAVIHEWAELGKETDGKVTRFLFDERENGKLWFDVIREGNTYKYAINAETVERLRERGIDISTPEGEHLAKLILDAKNALMLQLNALEQALTTALQNRFAGAGSDTLRNAIIPLKRQIHLLRKVPFFPQGRFGNYIITVEKKRQGAAGYEVIYREAFESRADWERATKEVKAKASAEERVRNHELTDNEYVLMALPTDFVDLAASELGLNDQQVEKLMQILQPVKTEKTFREYDKKRLGLKGYSTDAMRSFANFTWHNANMIAKLEYRSKFNMAIRGVGVRLRVAEYAGPQALSEIERLGRIKAYMERTRDYIMAPPYEAQGVRAVVSIAYLGLNVKTALINFYGLVTTWSDLTSRYGQVDGNTRFLRAMKRGFASLKLTDLNDRREGSYLPPEIQAALDRAIEEGVLSQSYAYHLAGMANAGNLWRLPARRAIGRHLRSSVDAAMYPFRLMELATRRISFLAEFEAAMQEENLGMSDAYTTAVTRTNKLQNDYSLGNRAPFLRGIKTQPGNPFAKLVEPALPLATVFMTFMQHMAFHTYGGYELGERRLSKQIGETARSAFGGYTMKIWLITLLLAGYEGLPGAENLLDLIEVAWRKFGGRKPMRQELRELVQSVDGDPQIWARGLGHNIAGFDVSRSVGLGRFFPGTDVLAHPRDNIAETVGTLAFDLAGPTGAFVKFGLDALFSNKPPAETFQRMPGGLGNIWSAYKWSQEGVHSPSGALVTHDLETGKLRDLTAMEIAGKTLGFNPTVVSQNREVMFAQYDRKIYWETRRSILLRDYWRAHWQKDREAQTDVRKAVSEFNASIPAVYKDLRVTGADIARSVQARERIRRFEEQQSTPQRRYRSLYGDVKGSFKEPQ